MNTSMDKVITSIIKCGTKVLVHSQTSMVESLKFRPTLYWVYDYLFMPGFKLIYVSKMSTLKSSYQYPTHLNNKCVICLRIIQVVFRKSELNILLYTQYNDGLHILPLPPYFRTWKNYYIP